MAVYSAVAGGEKDAESPVDENLIDKLDQNPEAIAEGASGAPRIQTAAMVVPTSGSTYTLINLATEITSGSLSYILASATHIFRCQRAGTYNVVFDLKLGGTGGVAAYGRIYKNGVAFGTEQSTASGTYVEKAESLTFAAGDTIELWGIVDGALASWDATDFAVRSSLEPYAAFITAEPV